MDKRIKFGRRSIGEEASECRHTFPAILPFAALVSAAVLCSVIVFAVAHTYVVDWIQNDDLSTLTWFKLISSGQFGFFDFLNAWDNQHPLGSQIALDYMIDAITRGGSRAITYTALAIICLTACLAGFSAAKPCRSIATKMSLLAICFVLAFHFTQMQHLLWAFEIGWFAINACFVINALVVERQSKISIYVAFLICLFATFCSAQGAFTWVAVALHYSLRSRRAVSRPSLFFLVCGGLALARVVAHGNGDTQTSLSNFSDIVGFAVYTIQLFGSVFGQQDPTVLLLGGALILSFCVALALLARGGDAQARRVGYVLVFAGLSAVLSFARGRFHFGISWATSSFHAAPLLAPLYLGLVQLSAAVLSVSNRRTGATVAAASATLAVLLAGACSSIPYGTASAKLRTMQQGYAKWVTCTTDLPIAFKARASELAPFSDAFLAVMPQLLTMCRTPESVLAHRLLREPPEFEALSRSGPQAVDAVASIWQDYATDAGLLRAFPVDDAATPARLIEWFQSDAANGSTYDPTRLGLYREAILKLKP